MDKEKKKLIKDKICAVNGFIKSRRLLLTLKPLGNNDRDEHLENDFLHINNTCYFLSAIIFELLIKIFYELENEQPCKKTHDLKEIYNELASKDKEFIKSRYEILSKNNELKEIEKKARIVYCNLDEAIDINENIVVHFKYDSKINKKNSVFNNLVRGHKTIFTIPNNISESFFTELLDNINRRFVS